MSLTTNLISYWKLDEASGNALDAHGANTLTETSGTIDSAAGKVGNCRDFESGDTEYFTCPGTGDFALGDVDFTFACWVNFESLVANGTILSKYFTTGSQRSFALRYFATSTRISWLVSNDGSATTNLNADNLGAPSTGVWYFVVVWHDSVNNVIGIQVNDGTANTSSYSSGIFNSSAEFDIGRAQSGLANHDGLIDEVGFWGRVLTAGEKTSLYNSGNGLAYPFSSELTGDGAASFTMTATAAGEAEATGAGAASFTMSATAPGTADATGIGSATFDFTGTGSGASDATGDGAASMTMTATATGLADAIGAGAATVTFQAAGVGDSGVVGGSRLLRVRRSNALSG